MSEGQIAFLVAVASVAAKAGASAAARTLAVRLTNYLCDRVLNGERSGPAGRTGRRGSADISLRQPAL